MLATAAAKRLHLLRQEDQQRAQKDPSQFTESLIDYIPRVTPRWVKPSWLWPYIELLERALSEPIRAVVAAPPQHGKTESSMHALAWAFRKVPGRRHAYATYAQKRSSRVSVKTKAIALRDGMDIKGTQELWYDQNGSSVLWTSVHGQFAGEPVDGLLLIDDPTKDRKDAESETKRADQIDWFDGIADPRCHPSASIIVMSTRWHALDLPGVLVKRGWQYINLKAIAESESPDDVDVRGRVRSDPLHRFEGEELCAARQPIAALELKRKTNAWSFASLYQGKPRPRDGKVFGEPHWYEELPSTNYRVAYGIDLAYSKKKKADWSVIIRMYAVTERISIEQRRIEDRLSVEDRLLAIEARTTYYIVDIVRKQVEAKSFLIAMKAMYSEQRGPMLWIASGVEKGTASFMTDRLPLMVRNANDDKYQRALPVSSAWNDGRVLVPRGTKTFDEDGDEKWEAPEWVDILLTEAGDFTGAGDAHDDIVDAMAAAHETLQHVPIESGDIPPPQTYESPMNF